VTIVLLAVGAPSRRGGHDDAVAAQPRVDLKTVLVRAGEYVQQYQKDFSLLVAEERYLQEVTRQNEGPAGDSRWSLAGVGSTTEGRRLRSEFALVRVQGVGGWTWMAFRDVVEVDGRAVPDRGERLERLFRDAPAGAFDRAMAIAHESARFNIGDLVRTVNVPTLALDFLYSGAQSHMSFRKRGEEMVGSVRAWEVAFEEKGRPTIIRSPGGHDVVSKGIAWIEPETGRIVRTQLDPQGQKGMKTRITVTFAPAERLGLWVPIDMKELYELEGRQITGEASYTNYRRFETDAKLKGPKGEVSSAASGGRLRS
jgi:hypothetical protein